MLSYSQLVSWYNRKNSDDNIVENETQQQDLEENFDRQYIKKKLEGGLNRIWHDVQNKVSACLMNSDLAYYKFDQFIQVLSIVYR